MQLGDADGLVEDPPILVGRLGVLPASAAPAIADLPRQLPVDGTADDGHDPLQLPEQRRIAQGSGSMPNGKPKPEGSLMPAMVRPRRVTMAAVSSVPATPADPSTTRVLVRVQPDPVSIDEAARVRGRSVGGRDVRLRRHRARSLRAPAR